MHGAARTHGGGAPQHGASAGVAGLKRPHLTAGERQVQRVFDFEHARYRDSQRVHFGPELAAQLRGDLGLPADWFAHKYVLDVGCGSGRWSYALATMGARVVAVDLTDSGVRATRAALAPFPNCVVHQASLFDLPYAPATFDLVMSWGVLHHTPSTRAAFGRIAPLVRPGGLLYIMLYERTARRYRILTDLLRRVFRRLPDGARYKACRALVIRDPRWYRRVSPWLKVCDGSLARTSLDLSTLAFDTFDAYSPVYNHVHTQTEVRHWFYAEGFSDVVLTHPVRFTTPDAVARWGQCGGAVHVRGVRSPSLLVTGARAAAHAASLRHSRYVADDEASGRHWLAQRVGQPAPQLNAAPVAPPAALSSMLDADANPRLIADRWHGVMVCAPGSWTVRRDGRLVTIAPAGAQPPLQLGLAVRPVRSSLESEASAAAFRWFGGEQRATLQEATYRTIAGQPALLHRYDVRLGEAGAEAHFAFAIHRGSLVQISAISAWDAPVTTRAVLADAFEQLLTTLRFDQPIRDAASLFDELRALGAAALGRIARQLTRLSPPGVAHRALPSLETAHSLESCYDAVLHLAAESPDSDLLRRAREVAASYVVARRAHTGPAAGRIVR